MNKNLDKEGHLNKIIEANKEESKNVSKENLETTSKSENIGAEQWSGNKKEDNVGHDFYGKDTNKDTKRKLLEATKDLDSSSTLSKDKNSDVTSKRENIGGEQWDSSKKQDNVGHDFYGKDTSTTTTD